MVDILRKKKLGLALSGGAAKGIAHIGVLQALKDRNLKISYISGTSVGAIIASLFSFEVELDEIGRFAKSLSISKISKFKPSRSGIFNNDNLRGLLREFLGYSQIQDAILPLSIIATDINSGAKVVLNSGDVCDAVCASSAIPGIFAPVEISGIPLVDGGLVQNLPVDVLREMGANFCIGSDLSSSYRFSKVTNIVDVIRNSFGIMVYYKDYSQIEICDLLISMELGDFSLNDNTDKFDELVAIGYESTIRALEGLKESESTLFGTVTRAVKGIFE